MNYVLDSPANLRIRRGDYCVIYISDSLKYILKIDDDEVQQTKFGQIHATDLIGHPYGTKFQCPKGWILPLRLTPELWTQLLPHRTQILYKADISLILLQLDIKPGSVVVESGTGSGSLSHAILRACMPNGLLYTFDINQSRVDQAREEFTNHGFGDNVIVQQRNIYELGYGSELEGKADACMLDLPQPWDAIAHANFILKSTGSRICTFSPCVEQVQCNVAKMRELKFKDIMTIECLLRPFEVKVQKLRVWTDEILEGLAAIDSTRFENLKNSLRPIKQTEISERLTTEVPRRLSEVPKISEDDDMTLLEQALSDPKANFTPNMMPKASYLHAKQLQETVSHSGYLTFASKRP